MILIYQLKVVNMSLIVKNTFISLNETLVIYEKKRNAGDKTQNNKK